MNDQFSQEEWQRLRTCVLALWIGFVFAVGAMATTRAGWASAFLIFVLVTGSFILNLGRRIFAPASVVLVCLTVLYLSNIWPDNDTMTRLAALMSRA